MSTNTNTNIYESLLKQFTPRSDWVPDRTTSACYHCNSQFNVVLRRRHHCRACGKIFCHKCCSRGINIQQKMYRLCVACNIRVQDFLKHKQGLMQNCILDIISKQYSQDEEKLYLNINSIVLQKLKRYSQYFFGRYGKEFVFKVLRLLIGLRDRLKPHNILLQGMNLTQKISIKIFQDEQNQLQINLAPGLILDNAPMNKRMQLRFDEPKVLLLLGQLNPIVIYQYQYLVANQLKCTSKVFDRIMELCPNIILLQGWASIKLQEKFIEKGVTLIGRVRRDKLHGIKTNLRLKNLLNLQQLMNFKGQTNQLIACCSKFGPLEDCFQYFKQKAFLLVPNKFSETVSLILSGKSLESLTQIKSKLRSMFVLTRHLFLQKDVVFMNLNLSLKINGGNNIPNFIGFMDDLIISLPYFFKQTFRFNKLMLYNTMEHFKEPNPLIFKIQSQHHYHRLCQTAQIQRRIYSKEDLTLGYYILSKISRKGKKCQKCNHPLEQHDQSYYWDGVIVRVEMLSTFESDVSTSQRLTKFFQHSDSEDQLQDQLDIKQIYQQFKEKLKKEAITTYIQCWDCQTIFTKRMAIQRNVLQYSFSCFLLSLAASVIKSPLKYDSQPQSEKVGGVCQHRKLRRVFRLQHDIITFEVDSYLALRKLKFNINGNELQKWQQKNFKQKLNYFQQAVQTKARQVQNLVQPSKFDLARKVHQCIASSLKLCKTQAQIEFITKFYFQLVHRIQHQQRTQRLTVTKGWSFIQDTQSHLQAKIPWHNFLLRQDNQPFIILIQKALLTKFYRDNQMISKVVIKVFQQHPAISFPQMTPLRHQLTKQQGQVIIHLNQMFKQVRRHFGFFDDVFVDLIPHIRSNQAQSLLLVRRITSKELSRLQQFSDCFFKLFISNDFIQPILAAYTVSLQHNNPIHLIVLLNPCFNFKNPRVYQFKGNNTRISKGPIFHQGNLLAQKCQQPVLIRGRLLKQAKQGLQFLKLIKAYDYSVLFVVNLKCKQQTLDGSECRMMVTNYLRVQTFSQRLIEQTMKIRNEEQLQEQRRQALMTFLQKNFIEVM